MSEPINTTRTRLTPGRRNPFLQVDQAMRTPDQIRDYSLLQTRAINRIAEELGLVDITQPTGGSGFGGGGTGGGGGGGGAPTVDLSQLTRRDGAAKPTGNWDMDEKEMTNLEHLQAARITLGERDLATELCYLENYAWLMG